jgi:hypothetical protein
LLADSTVIARIWRGAVRKADRDRYARYMNETDVAGYASVDAVKAFAGEDYETAVFYPEDDRYLIERDLVATHYQVEALP